MSPVQETRCDARCGFYRCDREVGHLGQHRTYNEALDEPLFWGSSDGVDLIAAERQRQIAVEGWTPEHDDRHDTGEIGTAAMSYVLYAGFQSRGQALEGAVMAVSRSWPWQTAWWKPSDDPIRNLVKAGALIAAEIDRLQRKAKS